MSPSTNSKGSDPTRFDPRCERMDTAVRAVVKLTVGDWTNWGLATRLGLIRKEHEQLLIDAVAEADDLRSEDELFALVVRCPFLVDAAQLVLGLYQAATYETREQHFKRTTNSDHHE